MRPKLDSQSKTAGLQSLSITGHRDRIFPKWHFGEDDVPALPRGQHNEAAYILSCILEGTPAGMVGPQVCCDAQEVLEAGARASTEQRMVPLPPT